MRVPSSVYLTVALVIFTFQEKATSLCSSPGTIFRKSILLPWNINDERDDRVVLGHCVEERNEETDVTTVRIWTNDSEHDELVLTFPEKDLTGEGLASQLWPAALSSSILLRSPEFVSFATGKDIVELGSGRGLAGLVAASSECESCLLTDSDAEAVEILETATCPKNQQKLKAKLATQRLDWRDDHRGKVSSADIILGSDIAYYWYLLRPIMDTTRAFMDAVNGDSDLASENDVTRTRPSTLFVVGQANRESKWDLYKNIQRGCYNQLTDEDELPWPGTTRMLLYNLRMSEWCETLEACENRIDGFIPTSLLVHHENDTNSPNDTPLLSPFKSYAHVATKKDDESIMKTF